MKNIIFQSQLTSEANEAARDLLGRALTEIEIIDLKDSLENDAEISDMIFQKMIKFIEQQTPIEDLYPYRVSLTMIVAPAQIEDVVLTWKSAIPKDDRKLYVKLEKEIKDSGIFDGAEFDVSRVRNVAGDTI